MPVISFANPKGGTGKSTSALILALEMAHRGGKVALIDCDPNQVTAGWAQAREQAGLDVPFEAIANPGEETIIDVLDELATVYPFVIVDLEGTASLMMSRTMSRSDLTVIPMQASPVDAKQAARAVSLVRLEEKMLRRDIPMRILMTRNNPAIKTRDEKAIMEQLAAANVPMLEVPLHERAAYRAVFTYNKTLRELTSKESAGLPKARENAEGYAFYVINALKSEFDAKRGQGTDDVSEAAADATEAA
jgi:chromosome partitioning protein